MIPKLEVLFSPAEFLALKDRDLSSTLCVVFDVLRATSSMVTALANGAEGIVPVEDISEALRMWQSEAGVLLAGERNGLRIGASLTGSRDFDLGNSPREFTAKLVSGRKIVMTTTNGTRALRACSRAQRTLVGSFLNLQPTAEFILRQPERQVLIVCSGTFEEAAYEDALAAGALCDSVWQTFSAGAVADSALMARKLWLAAKANPARALSEARNGERLLSIPELQQDVEFCAQVNRYSFCAGLDSNGLVKRID